MNIKVDGTGTIAITNRLEDTGSTVSATKTFHAQEDVVDATPFNENLFMDEDLDGLDDELKELDIDDCNKSD